MEQKTNNMMDNPEFQSSLVRLGIWVFAAVYIGIAVSVDYFKLNSAYYLIVFGLFFAIFLGIFLSIFVLPRSRIRKHFSLFVDITAVSMSIFMTSEAVSPFYLLYIWIFVSYGTRYGKEYLKLASLLSVLAYSLVLYILGQLDEHIFEAIFFLLLLVILPFYQYILIRKLQDARFLAEKSSRVKTAFLSNMTHELRTPLSGIIGMAQLLKNTKLDAQQRDYVDAIASSSAVLNALIGDVLDVSKIEAEKLELEDRPFNIRQLIYEVGGALAGQSSEKGLELVCDVGISVPAELVGDELRVRQVLFNLVSNAIKFTNQGEVIVCVSWDITHESKLLLEIKDTGIGLSAEKKEQIFESFWQGEDSRAREYGGTGLGTTIVRNLVQAMLGTINIISEENVGTNFQVYLPLKERVAEATLSPASCDLASKHMLVYESNPHSMRVIESMMTGWGVSLIKATEPSNLVAIVTEAIESKPLDLAIICDTPLGGKMERVAALLRDHLGDKLPVLYIGYQRKQANLKGKHLSFVNKPVYHENLSDTVCQLILGKENAADDEAFSETLPEKMVHDLPVLMAEDNEINARVLQALLEELGCCVTWAKNGQKALDYAKTRRFKIAFIDLHMPVMNGLDFTQGIRAYESEKEHLQIVALTANISSDVRIECLQTGMDDFLNKPVDSKQLAVLLGKLDV